MKILVTGGTGFVGSHTVRQLVSDGHDVRLLVRSERSVTQALTPLGLDASRFEIVLGDVTDRDSIRKAVDGMQAVVHGASVFTMDKRREKEINKTNRYGTEVVLHESWRAGLDPIVHVSSVGALLPAQRGSVISDKSPPSSMSVGPYIDSKAEQEVIARDLQAKGAPVTITYPGAVMGPHDPHWGDGPLLIESVLKNRVRAAIHGCLPIVDVRDVARLHSAVMNPGAGPRRFMFSGTSITFVEFVSLLSRLTGRTIHCTIVPSWLVTPIIQLMDKVQGFVPFRMPVTTEGLTVFKRDLKFVDSTTVDGVEVERTDLKMTMTDMIKWMYTIGQISPDYAGKLSN